MRFYDFARNPLLILETRKKLGETQTEFAKRFGVKYNTICRYEIGERKAPTKMIEWCMHQ